MRLPDLSGANIQAWKLLMFKFMSCLPLNVYSRRKLHAAMYTIATPQQESKRSKDAMQRSTYLKKRDAAISQLQQGFIETEVTV